MLAIDGHELHTSVDLAEQLARRPPGVPLRLRLRQPAVADALAARGCAAGVSCAAWVRLSACGLDGADRRAARERAAARLHTILSPAADLTDLTDLADLADADAGAGVEGEAHAAPAAHEPHPAAAPPTPPLADEGMAVLVLCGERILLIRLRVRGRRRGVLKPERCGPLCKRPAAGSFALQRWKPRHFELRGGSLYYYDLGASGGAPPAGSGPKGHIPLQACRRALPRVLRPT